MIGQPSLYGLALDLLIEAQVGELDLTNEGWKLHLKLAVAKGGFKFHRLRFWIERENGEMVVSPMGLSLPRVLIASLVCMGRARWCIARARWK